MSHSINLRRSTRLARAKFTVEENIKGDALTENASEDDASDTGNFSHNIANIDSRSVVSQSKLSEELELMGEDIKKPSELFSDNDVCGQMMYGFHSATKRNAMTEKANACRSNPISEVSPKLLKSVKVVLERMSINEDDQERSVSNKDGKKDVNFSRYKVAKRMFQRRMVRAQLSESESESVSEDSEFAVSDGSDVSTDSEDTGSEDENASEVEDCHVDKYSKRFGSNRPKVIPTTPSSNIFVRQGNNKRGFTYQDFRIQTDEYFEKQAEKSITSNHTLSKLANPRLTEAKLQQLLINEEHVLERHRKSLCDLSENYQMLFPMWHFILEQGYSLLLHGIGSKRNLINNFHKEVVIEHPAMIVNGFFPSLTIKDVLDGIIVDLLGIESPTHPSDCVDLIEDVLKQNPNDRLYLFIHNIDGAMLRGRKCQDALACLATIPNLRMIASMDHVNGPLLWDHGKRSKFNFYWLDTTTLLPYVEETSYEGSLLVQRSGALALSSLRNVFLSLTSNARSIYVILVKYQLEHGKGNSFAGMAFKDLYRTARESFLVSSDLALRAQLTEFIDHKLVRRKRNVDGVEHLLIPLNNSLLKQFLEQQQ